MITESPGGISPRAARLRDVGNFELAVEEMLSAYKVYRDLRDQRKTGSVLISLADVYKHFNPEHGLWTRRSETEPVNARKVIHPQP